MASHKLEIFIFAYVHGALKQAEFQRRSTAGTTWKLPSFDDNYLAGMGAIDDPVSGFVDAGNERNFARIV